MSEERKCNELLPHRSSVLKKKKKRNKGSADDLKPKEKPGSISTKSQLPPQDSGQTQFLKRRASSKKAKVHCSQGVGKTKEQQKDSKSLFAAVHTISDNKVSAHVIEVGVKARESLRWEGVLQDPQEEAKRMETYRANRRQRYITHREGLLKEAQHALRKAELNTSGK